MKIGITGASGQLGQLVVSKLKAIIGAGSVVGLVRSPEKMASLGIESRKFDYNHPEDLTEALQGIDKLLLISGNEMGKRLDQHKAVIHAAKEAGIKHLVYTSLLRADSTTLVLGPEHSATEEAIKESGIPYTILRNGWYNENYTATLSGTVAVGTLYGASGEGKISSASREDFAEAAATVLTDDGHLNVTYELAGDEAYTMEDYAHYISNGAGKTISYVNLSEEDFAKGLVDAGLPEPVAGFFAGTHTATLAGDLYDNGRQLSKLIGRPTTPISASIAELL